MCFVGVVNFSNIATIFITSAVITVSIICHAVVVAVAAVLLVVVND